MHESALMDVQRFVNDFLDEDRCYCIADIGAYDMNGNARPIFQRDNWQYIGLDLVGGPNVDHVIWPDWLNIDLESFDVAISVATLEHVAKPWEWIKKLASRVKPGGLVYINAPNTWGYHEHPIDCWRIWPMGMKAIFEEGEIVPLELYTNGSDTIGIGVKAPVDQEARLRGMYSQAVRRPSDIQEHMPYLRQLGSTVETIAEFGTRSGVSTIAFAASSAAKLQCFDLHVSPEAKHIWAACGDRMTLQQANVLEIDIDPVDLLFIDTWHTYLQMQQELKRHASKAKRFIVLHDTASFGERGEDGGRGIWPAVEEFLAAHREWVIDRKVANNNGLTTLRRVGCAT